MSGLRKFVGTTPTIRLVSLIGCGLVLTLCAPLDCAQAMGSYHVVYPFQGGSLDGSYSASGLVADALGNLYGTAAYSGHAGCGGSGCGIVFKLSQSQGVWTESVLHLFIGGSSDGGVPVSDPRLTMDANGILYGSTDFGGSNGTGTVFSLDPSTGTEKVLYSFAGGSDGAHPYGAPIFDKNGNLFGTTTGGGANGGGAVYKLASDGTETVLHSFGAGNDGSVPKGGLITYRGNFYGTTQNGGEYLAGTIFEITPKGVETVLYNFTGGDDGAQPGRALISDKSGNFYGTAFAGGAYGAGTVFELGQSNGTWTETPLYTFTGGNDGALPFSTLVADRKGNLYGTTYGGGGGEGVAFKLAPDHTIKVLHSFKGGSDGGLPQDGLTIYTDGNLYGTAATGGGGTACNGGCGIVFGLAK